MSHPNLSQSDRDAIEDCGLVYDDDTEDLREIRKAPVAPEALRFQQIEHTPTITQERFQ